MTDKSKDRPAYSTGAHILAAALRRQADEEPNRFLMMSKMDFADKAEAALTKGA